MASEFNPLNFSKPNITSNFTNTGIEVTLCGRLHTLFLTQSFQTAIFQTATQLFENLYTCVHVYMHLDPINSG